MIYNLGDKFEIDGILSKVSLINNGSAWLSPVEDTIAANGEMMFACATFVVLDEKGRDKNGKKAIVIHNSECKAV